MRWMLEEVGEPYETVMLEFDSSLKADWYRQLNPMTKVPTVKHGATVVTECAAICTYLADVFPAAGLAPKPEYRGSYYRWLFFAAGPIEQSTVNQALGVKLSLEQEGMAGYGSSSRVESTLSELLKHSEFVAGDQFTAADLYLASQVEWNMNMGAFEKRPEFIDYSQRMHSRPACIRAIQLDDDALVKLESS